MANAPVPSEGFVPRFRNQVSPRLIHTGSNPAAAAADFNNTTPSATETYFAEIFVPAPCNTTGVAVFSGAVWSDNFQVALLDATGAVVATTASTAGNTTADNYQSVAWSSVTALNPGTYFIALQINGTTSRFNSHILGAFGAGKATSTTYGTFTSLTPPVTFTTALGPVASLY